MVDLETAAPEFQRALLERIEARPYSGLPDLPPTLRQAYLDVPRHRFVDRYRLAAKDPLRDIGAGDPREHLAAIYSDEVLGHVDADGAALPSTNSMPSFILRLVALLDLKPGQRVLEIGSGGGWLLGMMARLVGPSGFAVGIEIIPDLAARSRGYLASVGIDNAEVMTGDGALGWAAGAPYDRVIFTTGIWDLPPALFDQVAVGGLLLAPFQNRGVFEDVLLLRRHGAGFISEAAVGAFFVRATGDVGSRAATPEDLDQAALLAELAAAAPVRRQPLGASDAAFGLRTTAFRGFLSRTEPRFKTFGVDREPGREGSVTGFGILDAAARSAAIWRPTELVAYGGPSAMAALMAAYQEWADLLMPTVSAFMATLLPAAWDDGPREPWTEVRGSSLLIWRLVPEWPRASAIVAASGMLPASRQVRYRDT